MQIYIILSKASKSLIGKSLLVSFLAIMMFIQLRPVTGQRCISSIHKASNGFSDDIVLILQFIILSLVVIGVSLFMYLDNLLHFQIFLEEARTTFFEFYYLFWQGGHVSSNIFNNISLLIKKIINLFALSHSILWLRPDIIPQIYYPFLIIKLSLYIISNCLL